MYKITSNGKAVAYTDSNPYVKVINGYSQPCSIDDAEGVVAGGRSYNLPGYSVFPNEPTAWVTKEDGWEIVFSDSGKITISQNNVADLQDAACETDERIDGIEEALCDLDERIGE